MLNFYNIATESGSIPPKRNSMYLAISCMWVLASIILWIDFATSLHLLDSLWSKITVGLLIFFVDLGWLYGFYHIGIVTFTLFTPKSFLEKTILLSRSELSPPIAILYTVCDDFQYEAVHSCVSQEYSNFHVYILDDSSKDEIKKRIDAFSLKFQDIVTVIRRDNRQGYKAGNINNALVKIPEQYKYIALADSDTHLPGKFLEKTSQFLEDTEPLASFVQTLHVANTHKQDKQRKSLGDVVRIGWNYYQPIRNQYGFPMCYGHGALIRASALKIIGGFPEVVSEDIALTLRLRSLGFLGFFTSSVICGEDYPSDYHTFRKRSSRWVSADLECFCKELVPLLKVKAVNFVEKLDALFRGLKVPLVSLFLPLSVMIGLIPFFLSTWDKLFSWVVVLITILTSLAPYYSFVVDMRRQPKRLLDIISHLTVIYCSCSFLFIVRTIEFLIFRKAQFHVTGAKYNKISPKNFLKQVFTIDETGYPLLGIFEIFIGTFLAFLGIWSTNFILVGISIALILSPAIYAFGWNNRFISLIGYVPFILILLGIISPYFWGFSPKTQCFALAYFSILLF